jgi:hypothetical protein
MSLDTLCEGDVGNKLLSLNKSPKHSGNVSQKLDIFCTMQGMSHKNFIFPAACRKCLLKIINLPQLAGIN